MIGCLWTRVRKQPNIALYFEFESLRFILSLRLFSSFITSGPEVQERQIMSAREADQE